MPSAILEIIIPPLSFLLKSMSGGLPFSLIPNPSNSCSIILLCIMGLVASSTIIIKLQVLATAMTCFPRPLPSLAPSMIPGKSSSWILAPLWLRTPGIQVKVVNSYAAIFENVPESRISYLWVWWGGWTCLLKGIQSYRLWHHLTLKPRTLLLWLFYHQMAQLINVLVSPILLSANRCDMRWLCSFESFPFRPRSQLFSE